MSILAVVTLVLVSPFMAISFLPALRHKEDEKEGEDETIVRWRK